MRIIIGMITKDSIHRIGASILRLTVHRALEELPNVDGIMIADASSDGTLSVIKNETSRHGVPVTVLKDKAGSRAYARSLIIARTPPGAHLMFLDDDAVLRRGWWRATGRLLNEGCAAVWGINWDYYPGRARVLRLFGISLRDYLIEAFWRRGGTHDLFLTPVAVNALKRSLPIPTWLHVLEDAYILRSLLNANVRVCVNEVGVIHAAGNASGGLLGSPIDVLKRGFSNLRILHAAYEYYNIDEYSILRSRKVRISGDVIHLMYALALKAYSKIIKL